MKNRVQGKRFCIFGKEEVNAKQTEFNRSIERDEICHIKNNVRNLVSKYSGVIGESYESITSSAQWKWTNINDLR